MAVHRHRWRKMTHSSGSNLGFGIRKQADKTRDHQSLITSVPGVPLKPKIDGYITEMLSEIMTNSPRLGEEKRM